MTRRAVPRMVNTRECSVSPMTPTACVRASPYSIRVAGVYKAVLKSNSAAFSKLSPRSQRLRSLFLGSNVISTRTIVTGNRIHGARNRQSCRTFRSQERGLAGANSGLLILEQLDLLGIRPKVGCRLNHLLAPICADCYRQYPDGPSEPTYDADREAGTAIPFWIRTTNWAAVINGPSHKEKECYRGRWSREDCECKPAQAWPQEGE